MYLQLAVLKSILRKESTFNQRVNKVEPSILSLQFDQKTELMLNPSVETLKILNVFTGRPLQRGF